MKITPFIFYLNCEFPGYVNVGLCYVSIGLGCLFLFLFFSFLFFFATSHNRLLYDQLHPNIILMLTVFNQNFSMALTL